MEEAGGGRGRVRGVLRVQEGEEEGDGDGEGVPSSPDSRGGGVEGRGRRGRRSLPRDVTVPSRRSRDGRGGGGEDAGEGKEADAKEV